MRQMPELLFSFEDSEKPMVEVKFKRGNYGKAIALLMRLGEGFQGRFERKLIVTSRQREILQEAGLLSDNGAGHKPRKVRDKKVK